MSQISSEHFILDDLHRKGRISSSSLRYGQRAFHERMRWIPRICCTQGRHLDHCGRIFARCFNVCELTSSCHISRSHLCQMVSFQSCT